MMRFRSGVAAAVLSTTLAIAACGEDQTGPLEATGKPARTESARTEPALRRLGEFNSPLGVYQPPRARDLLLIPEKRGVIKVLRDDERLARPFLDLRRFVTSEGTEQGLTGIAFPANYRQSRRFYVSYTAKEGGDLRIEEYRGSRKRPTVARQGTRRTVLTIRQPEPIHNGGAIQFGPDGYLYIGAGDGGPSYDPENRGQDLDTLLGKLLRIEPRRRGKGKPYGIPKGNPFRGRGRAEVYAYGLRNPWRFSFDRETGSIWIGDVGQDQVEEISTLARRRLRGANFGWSGFEGTLPYKPRRQAKDVIPPFHEYLHEGRCSVTGGYVVRDPKLPSLDGQYIYGDFCDGLIRVLTPASEGKSKNARSTGLEVPGLVSFGEDHAGHVYAVSLRGPVYRLVERSTGR